MQLPCARLRTSAKGQYAGLSFRTENKLGAVLVLAGFLDGEGCALLLRGEGKHQFQIGRSAGVVSHSESVHRPGIGNRTRHAERACLSSSRHLLPVRKCERAYDDQHKTRIARFREKATAFCCVPGNFGFIQLKPESATPL